MDRFDVHVCLVSDHPLPNLLPILDDATRPRKVVLMVSDSRQGKADSLAASLRDRGCEVEQRPIRAWRIEDIRDALLEVLDCYGGSTLALNATGGTKVMALGAVEVFRAFAKAVFYVDTSNDSLMLLGPNPATLALPDLIGVKTYLRAYGYRIDAQGACSVLPARRELGHWLAVQAAHMGKAMASLNWYAASAEKGLSANLTGKDGRSETFRELLSRFKAAGALDHDGEHLVFPDEDARRYVNGGWLEEYVFGILQGLKKEKRIQDWIGNAQVVSDGGVRNELDAAFTRRNRLHLIECKTANLTNDDERAAGVAYKLETLSDLIGGVFGRSMLVSYRPLVASDLKRCREYNLRVVQGEQLARLREHIIEWTAGS